MSRRTVFATIAFLFSISLFCIDAVDSEDAESPAKADSTTEPLATSTAGHRKLEACRENLEQLQELRRTVVEAFVAGEEHPRVKAIDEEIGVVTKQIEALTKQEEIEALTKQEEIEALLTKEIEALEREIDARNAPRSTPDADGDADGDADPLKRLRREVQSMNDQQLRATVELLIDRLLELEDSVREMKDPRFRLLH